jgi:hypothetical protein
VLEDVVAHVCVHRRQGVVQQVHSAVVVHGAGQAHLKRFRIVLPFVFDSFRNFSKHFPQDWFKHFLGFPTTQEFFEVLQHQKITFLHCKKRYRFPRPQPVDGKITNLFVTV